ncbi:carboxylesterase/lipase family protein [Chitinasiproducens palmae]|uniref:Carboxylic ester hydrolase n=1 Tax=Chitinasiproducens palmae TaxID=1770053 RepID=A0A1H2PR24_9BURK|nr:carboxylesterase family protein [Chitinasiproducens palmae]SDV48893.1 para-nitrobenzyl esterase [Chitinasiproducens palmae]
MPIRPKAPRPGTRGRPTTHPETDSRLVANRRGDNARPGRRLGNGSTMPFRLACVAASLSLLSLTGCGGSAVPTESANAAPIVALTSGKVRGSGDDIVSFKGIPYAKPPTGALRWTAPIDPEPWTGVRDASAFGPECMQAGTAAMSEDCLFINVWAPRSGLASTRKLPVLVWVYGGSFTSGNGNVDGSVVANHGAVVVSMNYRVSTMGFMAHPGLSAESARKVSGNYGILDVAQALKWVRANIAQFGGDPTNVTIWGESAGASVITTLLSSPESAGLIDRAILESPGSWRHWKSLAAAEQDGLALGADIQALRALPATQIPVILNPGGGAQIRALAEPRVIGPVQDGVILPHEERVQFEGHRATQVPLLVGNNTDEGYLFTNGYTISTVDQYRSYLSDPAIFGSFGNQAFSTYPVDNPAQIASAIALSFGDDQFWFGARGIARLYADAGLPVYRYYFTRKQLGGTGSDAHHGDDVAYVFGDAKLSAAPYTADDVRISNEMIDAWVRFAATGNPNGGAINDWPKYETTTEPVYQIDASQRIVNGPRNAQLDFIAKFDASIPAD